MVPRLSQGLSRSVHTFQLPEPKNILLYYQILRNVVAVEVMNPTHNPTCVNRDLCGPQHSPAGPSGGP